MAVNWRKVLAVLAIILIIGITSFLLYWFLGRKTDAPINYKLVEFDEKKAKSTSFNGDKLPAAQRNECGQPFFYNQTATGGFIAPGGTFGWTAYFDYSTKEGSTADLLRCGGSVINERYILTAAHCIYGTENQKLKM